MFRYQTGEDVQLGDEVVTALDRPGVVIVMMLPGTPDAQDWACPGGGLVVEEQWDDTRGFLAVSLDSLKYLKFVRRGPPRQT